MRPLLLVLLAGCADHDLCAGHDGTCIGLVAYGPGNVDQLHIQMSGAARLDGRTPDPPGAARALPVSTALFLPPAGGLVDITVDGLLSGNVVGAGLVEGVVRPGEHLNVRVTLVPPAVVDLGPDLRGEDLAVAADLSSPDLSQPDLLMSSPDLLQPDLIGFNPRYVFLLPARSSLLGAHAGIDNDCLVAAAAAGLPGASYLSMIAYPPADDPASTITLGQGRPIIKPDGTQVSDDADFFSGTVDHLAPIDELADGTIVTTGCAYTNFGRTGSRISSPSDCAGWSDNTSASFGTVGDVKASDAHWTFRSANPIVGCDVLSCGVYCIQQD
jgi:hypothetical protein